MASMDDFSSPRDGAGDRTRGSVGQSLGSRGPEMLETDALGIGDLVKVSAAGAWSRTVGYWSRSPWAGRRSLQGRGSQRRGGHNPLAHAVATALAVVGCRRREDVESVETGLYRANAIDSDDTSVVRIRTTRGLRVTCALSLCSPVEREPQVHIQGTLGRPPSLTPPIGWRSKQRIGAAQRSQAAWTCSRPASPPP